MIAHHRKILSKSIPARPAVNPLAAPLQEAKARCQHLEDQLRLVDQENLALLNEITLLQARLNQWESDLLDAFPTLGQPDQNELLYGVG